MRRKERVLSAHNTVNSEQLEQFDIHHVRGRAKFISPHEIAVVKIGGKEQHIQADIIVIAVGSQPRAPDHIAIDHEHLLDSDSFLSMIYQPKSLDCTWVWCDRLRIWQCFQ